jgi:hypothetical protein
MVDLTARLNMVFSNMQPMPMVVVARKDRERGHTHKHQEAEHTCNEKTWANPLQKISTKNRIGRAGMKKKLNKLKQLPKSINTSKTDKCF